MFPVFCGILGSASTMLSSISVHRPKFFIASASPRAVRDLTHIVIIAYAVKIFKGIFAKILEISET